MAIALSQFNALSYRISVESASVREAAYARGTPRPWKLSSIIIPRDRVPWISQSGESVMNVGNMARWINALRRTYSDLRSTLVNIQPVWSGRVAPRHNRSHLRHTFQSAFLFNPSRAWFSLDILRIPVRFR